MQTPVRSSPLADGVYLAVKGLAYVAQAGIAIAILYGAGTALRYWSGIGV
jgi:hypothetical protein